MQLDYQSSTSISHFSAIFFIFLHLLSYSNVVFVPVFLAFVLYVVGQFCVCIKINKEEKKLFNKNASEARRVSVTPIIKCWKAKFDNEAGI